MDSTITALLGALPEARRVRAGPSVLRAPEEILVLNPSLRPRALARDLALLAAWRGPAALWIHGGSRATWDALRRPGGAAFVRRVARRAVWVVLAARFGARLVALGVPTDRIRVIGPAFDPRSIPAPSEPGLDVLFLGRLTEDKGPDRLLEAFARLPADPGRRLVLAGEGPLRPALADRARALGIADRVVLPGWVDGSRRRALLAQAALVALPSRDEAVPVCLIEAIAAGRPVVATDVGAVSETIAGAGRLVAPGDPQGLEAALRRSIETPIAVDRSLAARWHPERVAEAWRALFRDLERRR